MVVLAVEDRLASSIFATCDVELGLPAIEDLMVAIKWTQEDFLHSDGLLNCLVHLGCRVVTAVVVEFACHEIRRMFLKSFSSFIKLIEDARYFG